MFAARGRFCLGQHREPRAAGPRLGQPRTASGRDARPPGGAVRLRRGWVEWEAGTAWPPRHACVERGPTPGLCYCSGGLPRAPASSYARGGPVPRHRLPDTTRSDRRAPCGRLGRFLPPPGAGVPAQRAEGAARLWGPAAFPEQQGGQGQSSGAVSYTHLRAHETSSVISYAVFCLEHSWCEPLPHSLPSLGPLLQRGLPGSSSSQAANTRPVGRIWPFTLFYLAWHLVSTQWQH